MPLTWLRGQCCKVGMDVDVSDLGLASALSCLGFDLFELDRSNIRRVIFRFKGDKKSIEDAVQSYWDRSLKLPPSDLFIHQKTLKQRLYGDY